jgi:hypothetical protein
MGYVYPIIAPIVVHPNILIMGVKNCGFCCFANMLFIPVKNPIEVVAVRTVGSNS